MRQGLQKGQPPGQGGAAPQTPIPSPAAAPAPAVDDSLETGNLPNFAPDGYPPGDYDGNDDELSAIDGSGNGAPPQSNGAATAQNGAAVVALPDELRAQAIAAIPRKGRSAVIQKLQAHGYEVAGL